MIAAEGGAAQGLPAGTPGAVAGFALYLLAMVAIGVATSRRSSSGLDTFFLAGRSLGKFVVALSAVASGRSSWLLLGFSGLAFARGASALWAAAGYVVVEAAMFWSLGRRLRRFSGVRDCLTVPDVLVARVGEGRGALRALLVVVVLAFTVPYLGAQFLAGGKTFQALFGLPQPGGIALTAAIVLAYTILGGMLAVSLTDLVQAWFMAAALVVVPVAAILDLGGFGAVRAELVRLDPALVDPFAIGAGALIGFVGIGLGSPGQPHVLARFMAIRDERELRSAAVVGTTWNVVMALGAAAIGLAARAQFGAAGALPAGDREQAYTALAAAHLSPVFLGLVCASILAAIMSTADSQLLVAAGTVVRDAYSRLFLGRRAAVVDPRRLDDRRMVLLSRAVIVVVSGIALGLAALGGGLVFWLVLFAWAGMGAALGPAVVFALYWRRTTRAGLIAGVLTGTTTVVLWSLVPGLKTSVYELIPAWIAGAAAIVVVSLLTRPEPDAEIRIRDLG
ncbi:MAG: sodium/proline symporter [Planctomycetes bacterium]|nr:sodium/proline symporter [Planctomycetota bacterium]